MGLEGDDDVILGPDLGGVVGAARMADPFLAVDQQLEAVRLHGREMGAAGDQGDIDPSPRKLRSEVAADGAGAIDADAHQACPLF